jgi:GMP synthase (glutamine-hydrolysing)
MSSPRIVIIQNDLHDGPGFLADFLDVRNIAFDLLQAGHGDDIPAHADAWDAIAVLGGPASVNEGLRHIAATERLLCDALDRGVPVIGHCLGGQLMARALGAKVRRNRVPEIGWTTIDVADEPLARQWLGAPGPRPVFQWHYDTFDIPEGARPIAGNAACRNQAFAFGRSLAMQFHVELDAHKAALWESMCREEIAGQAMHDTVQQAAAQRAATHENLQQSQVLAAHIYERWLINAHAYAAENSSALQL